MYSCLSPKKIVNKATGEEMYVDCRQCEYCRNKRAWELSARIDREFLDPSNKFALFVTLTYDNDNLPVYTLDRSDNTWYSNREDFQYRDAFGYDRYPRLQVSDVDTYYNPVKMENYEDVEDYTWFDTIITNTETSKFEVVNIPRKIGSRREKVECFGHLCYIDVLKFLSIFRGTLYNDFKINRRDLKYKHLLTEERVQQRNYVTTYFKGFKYDDVKFRYFLCGEYGPWSYRPHYHIVLWFSKELNEQQISYFEKVICESWPFGLVDCKAVTYNRINNYVSSYITSSSHLPKVLRRRHLRPFVLFSKSPCIGSYQVDDYAVQKVLVEGTYELRKFNQKTGEYEDVPISPTFYNRYFPRCNAFGYADDKSKLGVYRYVSDFFKFKGITHTAKEVEDLRLMDVEWTPLPFIEKLGEEPVYQEWRYLDKYASMVCYRYCVKFGMTPEQVLEAFERIYSKLQIKNLNRFYADCEELSRNDYYV